MKINMFRTMILTKTLSFPIGSIGVVQHEDKGPWTHWVIKEANSSDHRGKSYIIRVTENGILLPQTHTQHPSNYKGTNKEGTGSLEDIFTQTVLVELDRIVTSYRKGSRVHMDNVNAPIGDKGEERYHVSPIQQSHKAKFRHIACDDKPDCISTNTKNMPANMTAKCSPYPIRNETRTRSA